MKVKKKLENISDHNGVSKNCNRGYKIATVRNARDHIRGDVQLLR